MIGIIRSSFLVLFLIILSTFLVANSHGVSLKVLPSQVLDNNVNLNVPLFLVIIFFTGIGLFCGYIFEYIRSHKIRKIARQKAQLAEKLSVEIQSLKSHSNSDSDEILDLLK